MICYVEVPALDIVRSAEFYKCAFGWTIRQCAVGRTAFDDAVGEVSGSLGLGSKEASEPGLLLCIMVNSAAATLERLVASGRETMQPMGADAPEIAEISETQKASVMSLHQKEPD
jgi:predicted enzyme related to lactoylglutathione lyase